MRSQSLIPYRSDSENDTASENNTYDQNGKPSTPSHTLNPTITTARQDPDFVIST